jgi:signal transduction histidine kinase
MDVAHNSPIATCWMLRRTEWILIAVYMLLGVMNGSFSISIVNSLCILVGIGVFVLLSFFFPAQHPCWIRQSYIALGIILVFIAWSQNLILDLFLYIYIAKSCFLLSRRAVIFTVVATGIGFVAIDFWTLPQVLSEDFSLSVAPSDPQQLQQFLLPGLGTYLVGSTFTVLFSYRVIAEQKSRQQAETLAQQVEQLATALERTRIARDIHDSLGHTLTSLQMQLVAAQRLRQHHLDQSFQATDTAKRLAEQCIEDLSQALQTMRQAEQVDINQSLSTLLGQLRQYPKLTVEWTLNLPQLPLVSLGGR